MKSSLSNPFFVENISNDIMLRTKTTQSKEDLIPQETTEDFLLKVSKYPIFFSQLNGYLPLTVIKSPSGHSTLKFSFFSIPSLVWLLQILYIPLLIQAMQGFVSSIGQFMASVDSDSIMLNLTFSTSFLHLLLNRVGGIFSIKSTLAFWQTNCELLHYQWNSTTRISPQQSQRIRSLQSFLKRAFIAMLLTCLPCGITSAVFDQIRLLAQEKDDQVITTINERELTFFKRIIIACWTFFNLTHPLAFLWVTVFPKLYSISLAGVADDLQSLSNPTPHGIHLKAVITNSSIDESVVKSIKMANNIFTLVKHYNSHFAPKLLTETVVNLISLLGLANFVVVWVADGQYSAAVTFMFPFVMTSTLMYHIAAAGSQLNQSGRQVVEAFHSLPVRNMSPEIQWEVQMVISKMTNYPLVISPGDFFTLNKESITSIVSFLVTSILVLAQFRGSPSDSKATMT